MFCCTKFKKKLEFFIFVQYIKCSFLLFKLIFKKFLNCTLSFLKIASMVIVLNLICEEN